MIYVFDASAMVAYLRDEPGADLVEAALLDAGNDCFAHAINLCEVFYDFYRSNGELAAHEAISDLRAASVIERADLDTTFWHEVGRLKARGKVSLADCFCITLTLRTGARLLTTDHHELDSIAAQGICPITFIR